MPDSEPLLPNWRWLPVGYHGRAGTVAVSGTDVVRPHGELKDSATRIPCTSRRGARRASSSSASSSACPASGPRRRPSAFADHVFGVVLVNDWSARDIQSLGVVPLGPFLGKSFRTSISAWVTPLSLLEPYRVEAPAQEPPPLPHLAGGRDWALDVDLELELNGERGLARQRAHALLDDAAAARARDVERRGSTHRRPDGDGTISGAEPARRARSSS